MLGPWLYLLDVCEGLGLLTLYIILNLIYVFRDIISWGWVDGRELR